MCVLYMFVDMCICVVYVYMVRFIHIVDLVTFLRNKYVTVEGVKIGSRIWKKVKWDLLNKPRMYIQYFVDLRKKCIFVHFYGVFTCILVFYV